MFRPDLVAAGNLALLVVAGGLVVGVDDGVGGHAVGVVGLGPGVDGVDIRVGVKKHGHGEKGEHCFCTRKHERNKAQHLTSTYSTHAQGALQITRSRMDQARHAICCNKLVPLVRPCSAQATNEPLADSLRGPGVTICACKTPEEPANLHNSILCTAPQCVQCIA
jgi:hypothetical protein